MRFRYVFLGLVTLAAIHTSSGQCSNDLAGVQNGDICCDAGCGTCGGGGCGRRPGGAENCCSSRIRDSGDMCSDTGAAPCIVDIQCASCRAVCDNGLPGVQTGNICCDARCGTCGGSGCGRRPGGSSNCCTSRISDSGMMCDTTMAAPCIINGPTPAPTETPTMAPTPEPVEPVRIPPIFVPIPFPNPGPFPVPSPMGVPTQAPTPVPTAAPTAMPTAMPTSAPTTAPSTATPTASPTATEAPVPTCSNGIPGLENGVVCCETQCGGCGGRGCGGLPGGSANCCTGPIGASGMMCSITMEAPCIIDN